VATAHTMRFFTALILAPLLQTALSTTLIAMRYQGGVVLGADSRTSSGGYVANKVARKFQKVSEHIAIMRSGSAADTQALAEELLLRLEEMQSSDEVHQVRVRAVATLLSTMCYQDKGSVSASLICAGWDPVEGVQVYSIPSGGALMPSSSFALSGSGAAYIYGFCESTWRSGLTQAECQSVVLKALALASAQDNSSGGEPVTLSIGIPANQDSD